MKPTLHLFALSLLGLLLAACHETADDNTEFSNWQERNESYFQQKYLSAVNGTALQDKTFILTKWSLNDSITTKAEDHIVVEVLEDKVGILASKRTPDGFRNGIWETTDGIDFQKVLEFRTEHSPSAFTWYKGCYYYAIGAGRFNFARVGKESGAIYKLDPSSAKAGH